MKFKAFLLLLFTSFSLVSQEKFSKEITFANDNDLYVSFSRDRYYTNGMFLSYRYLSKIKSEKHEKRILEWQIGHEMFTPYKAVVPNISLHDRPFAAYLYGSFGINRVYKTNKIFNTTLQIGVIGENAFGKELQYFIHNIYGFDEAVGWEHQIANAFAINLNLEYVDFLTKSATNGFDLSWINTARVGTVYTNISSGLLARFGFKPLASILNSIGFGTNLNDDTTKYSREVETYFYIKPMVRYALYDATIQGSFLNTSSEVTKELVPVVFDVEIGFKFTANRVNFGYVFNYNTSKSEGLRYTYGNKYGTISISYLLH
ncbi:MAG: lipid A deacylase LpxR family protein [Polaribacter sp.]|uniref:lipid A deacylase LpxR family protein n=1 Tax=Polaribacter sp. TaxID=1920175 RepID=UPI003BB01001